MARESRRPLGVCNPLPPPPNTFSPPPRCPYHIILLVSVDVGLPSPLYNDPSRDSLTAGLSHQYRHPNLLLDPTHPLPLHKNTTSLPDMLLSQSFLWRSLKATVPTMTLSLRAEAARRGGPVGYFSMNGAGR